MKRIFRVTPGLCIACGKCELACAFAHGELGKPAKSRINISRESPDVGIPIVCLQCDTAACLQACPTNALARDEKTGAIVLKSERCISCRICVGACPFGNISFDEVCKIVQKCDLCGGEPRCAPFCPTRAIEYIPIKDGST